MRKPLGKDTRKREEAFWKTLKKALPESNPRVCRK